MKILVFFSGFDSLASFSSFNPEAVLSLFSLSPCEAPGLSFAMGNGTKGDGVNHSLWLWMEYGISLLTFVFEEEDGVVAER